MMFPGFAGLLVSAAICLTPGSPRYVMNKRGFDAGVDVLKRVGKGDVSAEAREMESDRDQLR